ncbi:hypothetical protein HPB52_021715 [Rhipicephalus sanguineus]|uniref:Uncharacterized protein n=1 Tax=Rhipicephalus sanguineus TaxID=34632 RepID=A0A9D4QAN9_RHISA|nr:hypothetical protein HPB52_021715 [Rhipicephalus sanguineus]
MVTTYGWTLEEKKQDSEPHGQLNVKAFREWCKQLTILTESLWIFTRQHLPKKQKKRIPQGQLQILGDVVVDERCSRRQRKNRDQHSRTYDGRESRLFTGKHVHADPLHSIFPTGIVRRLPTTLDRPPVRQLPRCRLLFGQVRPSPGSMVRRAEEAPSMPRLWIRTDTDVPRIVTVSSPSTPPVYCTPVAGAHHLLGGTLNHTCSTGIDSTRGLQNAPAAPHPRLVCLQQQQALLEQLKSAGVKLAGDSRADSPGYTAKYGTYSFLETTVNRLVDVRLVQSNEVASINHMELEGLKRALQHLDDSGIPVREVVTDRHVQVRKIFKTVRPGTSHQIDSWHVSKI